MVSCHYLNDDNSDGGAADLPLPQLLLGNCHLFIYDCIPPRGLLNEFLLAGEGHTVEHRRVRWLPFALDEAAQRCHQAGVAGDTAGRKYWEGEWMHRVLERARFQQPYFPDVPGEGVDEA